MDEEEQKSDSKISVSSFFERVDSIDKVANSALSKTRSNFSIIDKQGTLINSINVSIEALETKVRDIASYILAEKKLEKDAEEDRLFEQQDEAQKGSMLERLAGLKSNNESEQTQAAGEEPKKGGGGILGTLLSLGIGAFALKFLWPAILPLAGGLIKGSLAKFAMFSIGGLGTLLKGVLVGTLGGLGIFGLGKMFTDLGNSVKDRFDKVAESSKKAINNFKFGKEGKVDGPDSLNVEGGAEGGTDGGTEGGEEKEMSNLGPDYKKQEEDAFKAAEDFKVEKSNLNLEENSAVNDMDDTLKNKDLVKNGENVEDKKKGKTMVRYKYGGSTALIEKDGELDSLSKDELADKYADLHKRYLKNPDSFSNRELTNYKIKLPGLMMAKYKLFDGNIQSVLQGGDSFDPYVTNRFKEEKLEPELESVKENKDLDLSLSESFSDKLQPLNEQIDTLSEDLTGSINTESGQMFSRPANSPNTTVTVFKNTSSNSPFTSLMSNKYLSLNKTLPPEMYRAYK